GRAAVAQIMCNGRLARVLWYATKGCACGLIPSQVRRRGAADVGDSQSQIVYTIKVAGAIDRLAAVSRTRAGGKIYFCAMRSCDTCDAVEEQREGVPSIHRASKPWPRLRVGRLQSRQVFAPGIAAAAHVV